ncbi:uncharacterized protein BX659_12915 [Orenia metallireducens]|uniref:HD/PDEase domain-containing protein n=1 Tax=Orenia metallireducens TaxID=1413210 RepID=A0A285IA62_9FIRM|nr:HD domain-containing protein [Orenia metallireducens]PRX22378.1 uncharacterized protein BX659_12915 [Orenia metallireducens]SNY43956.1 uncharacterized protein SAMN06265827_13315 [Orenia metallireducens]
MYSNLINKININLKNHIENNIIPLYDNFDKAHSRRHVNIVINKSLHLASLLKVRLDITYAAAAYHDIGLGYYPDNPIKNRKDHHKYSQILVKQDRKLKKLFKPEELELIAQACHDHRASLKEEPLSIYGKIIADADRMDGLKIEKMISRAWEHTIYYNPELTFTESYQNIYEHLKEKYSYNGYAYRSFYLKESQKMIKSSIIDSQKILDSEDRFKEVFYKLIDNQKIRI